MPFSFRVKLGQREIEISRTQEEVMKAIEDFPKLMESIYKAFEVNKIEKENKQPPSSAYPSVSLLVESK